METNPTAVPEEKSNRVFTWLSIALVGALLIALNILLWHKVESAGAGLSIAQFKKVQHCRKISSLVDDLLREAKNVEDLSRYDDLMAFRDRLTPKACKELTAGPK